VWLANLDPTREHEQAGTRPVVVVSTDLFNHGPAELVVVVPMTTTDRGLPLQVLVEPPEGGVRQRSFAMCENIRALSVGRLVTHWGMLKAETVQIIEDRLRILLQL
jgi:mRNA interferase MazF